MNVGELCNRDVVVAYRETGLIEAARLMREHHVGCLVVVGERLSEELPIGMITDRDIVVAAVAKEVDPRTLTVGDVMSAGALVVREQDGITDALRMMRVGGVRRVRCRRRERSSGFSPSTTSWNSSQGGWTLSCRRCAASARGKPGCGAS